MMYYIVEKLSVSRGSAVSPLTLISTNMVLYAIVRLAECGDISKEGA